LVKSQQWNFHCYRYAIHSGLVPIFLSFKYEMSNLFPTNL
jgi:hypothetical protein